MIPRRRSAPVRARQLRKPGAGRTGRSPSPTPTTCVPRIARSSSRLLGGRASRQAAWEFLRDGWNERVVTMDPMLRQYVIRAMASLTSAPTAQLVGEFLASHVTDETRETTAQATEQLRIDAAAVVRMAPELTGALAVKAAG